LCKPCPAENAGIDFCRCTVMAMKTAKMLKSLVGCFRNGTSAKTVFGDPIVAEGRIAGVSVDVAPEFRVGVVHRI